MVKTQRSGVWGGRRSGAGRIRQRITLDLETATILRDITQRWREEHPEAGFTPTQVVARLIQDEAQRRESQP